MTNLARGTFDVTITPGEPTGPFGRMTFDKRWHGDLAGSGQGEMLTSGDPAAGAAAYVALEGVEGALSGRRGSLSFHQYGTMVGEEHGLIYEVVTGSGDGELAGITGSLALTIEEDGTHRYELSYELPG